MIIKNVNIITWNQKNEIIENGAIEIKNGKICNILRGADSFTSNQDDILDGKNQFIMPGNICSHTHFYSAFSRGMSIKGNPPLSFPEILSKLWWPLDKALDLESIKLSAELSIIDAIKHGTTTLFDHHASQNSILNSLETIAKVVEQAGIRADLCYEVSDRAGKAGISNGIKENIDFFKSINNSSERLLNGHFGLHASLSLSENTLEIVRENTPIEMGFHIHAAEHSCDEYDSMDQYGMRVIERLQKHSLLNSKTIIAHGVYLNHHEIDLIRESNCWLSHQPRSNMNNGVGLADIESLLNSGINVVLGNDGFSNSMWDEWKTCYLAHKLWRKDPRSMPADLLLKMAIINNRLLANQSFTGCSLGVIEVGAAADLILVNFDPFTKLTSENLPWQLIFGFRESMITGTIVNGKLLMKDRQLLTIDEEKVTREALAKCPEVWNSYEIEASKGRS